jgi:DNA-binding Lrp family transcriptional regulator
MVARRSIRQEIIIRSICATTSPRGAHGVVTRTSMHVRLSSVTARMDATDARLVLALSQDPRSTVLALAQRLGLARNTVQARLARLESAGVLDPFERRVRPEALGYRLGAYITVQVVQRSLDDVAESLAAIPEVLEVVGLSGVTDLLVQVVAVDADDLWRITEQVLTIPGVQRTDTNLALRRFVDHRTTPLLERAAGAGRTED